ncbi:MAG: CDP-diacylglycerol--glycerol-3-phosphate 3-phosphatidyltransferase [Hyphomicrobiaceae bacterium]
MTDLVALQTPLTIPNLLTVGRVLAVPLMVASLFFLSGDAAHWTAAGIFMFAAVSDFFDGYLARMWQQQSAFGRMLDPIADKLLVGAALLMLVYTQTIEGWSIWAAVIILCREILVSGLREFLASVRVELHVSWLAKWKTVMQMASLCLLLVGPACGSVAIGVTNFGLALLWVAAILTLWTGYGYLNAAVNHALRND